MRMMVMVIMMVGKVGLDGGVDGVGAGFKVLRFLRCGI